MKKELLPFLLLLMIMPFIVNAETKSIKDLEVGDYITVVPNAESYTISKDVTGYTENQTINPSELTLWRIINKNSDGTVDAVSEYTSSSIVNFRGTKGYAEFINTLQTIASQYAVAGYTSSTRIMGYDGQTLKISNTSAFDGTNNEKPSEESIPIPTTGTGQEYQAGVLGDTLYLKDYLLVKNVYNDLKAKKVATDNYTSYWLASRRYYVTSNGQNAGFCGRSINSDGSLSSFYYVRYISSSSWSDTTRGFNLRPIITLKSILSITEGDGTVNGAYKLEVPETQHEISVKDDEKNDAYKAAVDPEEKAAEEDNSDTGAFVSIVAIGALAIIGIILYIVSKKKKMNSI